MQPYTNDPKHDDAGSADPNGNDPLRARPAGPLAEPSSLAVYAASLLQVLIRCGYALWMLLGLALALHAYSTGRSDALVPLAVGATFVGLGLLAAGLNLPARFDWFGWRPRPHGRPGVAAMVALATWLPMLAVAGLTHGNNDFWATRLAAAGLWLGSAVTLVVYACHDHAATPRELRQPASARPLSCVLSSCYSGGLWLWLCVVLQDQTVLPPQIHVWVIGLLLLALLLGLTEGIRWQSLRAAEAADMRHDQGNKPRRLLAAVLIYAVPCVALLLADRLPLHVAAAIVAAVCCVLGLGIELHGCQHALDDCSSGNHD